MADDKLPDFMYENEGLTWALARAQFSFPAINKSHTANAGSYSYKYADLADVLSAIRPALNREGIALVQTTEITEAGVELVTSLLYADERLSSRWPLPIANAAPQQVGSVLTYLRRYALCALVGIAAEDDDDGRAASDVRQAPKETSASRDFSRGSAPTPTTTGDPYAAAAATRPEKPLAAMTAGEMARYGESIGVRVSGNKSDILRQLEPYVKAAEGTEPFELDGEKRPPVDPETRPFEPVVAGDIRDAP